MPFRHTATVVLTILLIASTALAQSKQQARVIPISETARKNLVPLTRLATADTCLSSPVDTITHLISGWVIGNELYKNYIDPGASGCSYPYTITAINMPMYFTSGASFPVSVDIESVDSLSIPGCNVPGEMIALSSDWDIDIPAEGGFYDIWIPLDSPITVSGPVFAGFFIGGLIDASTGVAVVVDSTHLEQCVSFNIWDPEIGFIDLLNNDIWNFPGVLVLYVSGYSSEVSNEPAPMVSFVNPTNGSVLFGTTELWAMDHSGSGIIEYVSFEYSDGGPWVEIASDFDGTRPLRDGVSSTYLGGGFSSSWNLSGIAEGNYNLRATMVDTLGRSSQDQITVYLEPTPPVPRIVSPNEFVDFCSPLKLIMNCTDENISSVQVEWQASDDNYSAGMTTLFQNTLGDSNGNPLDGNRASAGEFGDYYNAPVAAAIAARLWFDRGYTNVMKDGLEFLSTELLVENLASSFMTRENEGTFDEELFYGLRQYFTAHGDDLIFEYKRNPDYFTLRKWVEGDQRAVIISLNGTVGCWLAVDGFKGWPADGTATLSVSVPMTGTMMDVQFRSSFGLSEVLFDGNWYLVDITISMLAKNWAVERNVVGIDFMASDGWSLTWIPSDLTEDAKYFFRAWTQDASGYEGTSSTILQYNCSQVFVAGDYNADGAVDVADLTRLIDFITMAGSPPEGGAGRADANCDNLINPADIIYFMNYLYGNNDDPCY